jgi:hypothetical protein
MLHRRAPGHAASVSGQGLDQQVAATGLAPDAILKECTMIGVERSYIEDEAVVPSAQIPSSVEFLKRVRL